MSDAFRLELLELLEPDSMLIVWGDGHESLFSYRLLRQRCTCARCVDEWTGEALLSPESISETIKVDRWEACGRYGLNMFFSDGHTTGIYTFKALRGYCPCPECVAAAS